MEAQITHKLLMGKVKGLYQLLTDRGISIDILTDEELEKLSDSDLRTVSREMERLARTPGG